MNYSLCREKDVRIGGEKLSIVVKEDDAKDPRAAAVRKCVVVGYVPKACSLALSIDKDS